MGLELSRRTLIGAAAAGGALVASGRARAAEPAGVATLFGPEPGIALLSRNENPYGPAPSAVAAMAESAAKGCYYADTGYRRLTAMIAERFGVTPKHVVIGSGSSEVLSAIALMTIGKGPTVAPDLYWDTTTLYGERQGAKTIRVAMRPDMGIDLDAMAAAATPGTALVHVCNPNNPTGMLIDGPTMAAFVRKVSPVAPVLVDEAYNELTEVPEASSVASLVKEGANLIVCRTFSKIYGMAGLRVGYALMQPALAQQVRGYLMSFGGSSAGLAAAIASFNDTAFTRFSKQRIVEARGMMEEAVKRSGLTALPSQANFLFVKVPDANAVQKAMAEHGILIRGAYGKWTGYSRVSTGRIEDVQRYVAALPQVVRA
ncbi:histidinol-phosphate aminotransferase [Sphingomonas guangdongensis]|uniref:histidinol-phosphate transaminase n=1 Tax=Sphingomonas guangdongensis TaxID=1141890 RepID=A0A285R338_9SPHN|nr:histidinol-phosphate transaminase [Sphingomonas guangdongensis]SOB88139.1 histidinol-phosphate aminotransferase [Sphingomonas guangdongensis]